MNTGTNRPTREGDGGGGERSDADLVSAVRHGDDEAYGTLWSRHHATARRTASRIAAPREVDDLVSESFAKVLRALREGGGPDLAFRPYLLSTLRRLHVDNGRRYHSRVLLTDDMADLDEGGSASAEDVVSDRAEEHAAVAAWRSLPEDHRTVLSHLVVAGRTPAEVAPLLGVTPNAVASRGKRARERLRQAFLVELLANAPDEGCREARTLLGGYVRSGLGARDRVRVDAHLATCPGCRAALEEVADTDGTLRRVVMPLVAVISAPGLLEAASGGGAPVAGSATVGSALSGAAVPGAAVAGSSVGAGSGVATLTLGVASLTSAGAVALVAAVTGAVLLIGHTWSGDASRPPAPVAVTSAPASVDPQHPGSRRVAAATTSAIRTPPTGAIDTSAPPPSVARSTVPTVVSSTGFTAPAPGRRVVPSPTRPATSASGPSTVSLLPTGSPSTGAAPPPALAPTTSPPTTGSPTTGSPTPTDSPTTVRPPGLPTPGLPTPGLPTAGLPTALPTAGASHGPGPGGRPWWWSLAWWW